MNKNFKKKMFWKFVFENICPSVGKDNNNDNGNNMTTTMTTMMTMMTTMMLKAATWIGMKSNQDMINDTIQIESALSTVKKPSEEVLIHLLYTNCIPI